MEALAAVGLASNIVQFVDTAAHIFKIGSQIRKNNLKDFPGDPRLVKDTMISLSTQLKNKKYRTCRTKDEQILNQIADDCITIAENLVTEMKAIEEKVKKVHQVGSKPARVAESIATAIEIRRKQPQMKELSEKLDQHRSLLGTSVMALIHGKVDATLEGIRLATDRSQQAHEETTSALSSILKDTTESRQMMLDIKEGIECFTKLLESNTIHPPIPRVFTEKDPSLKSAALHGHGQVESKFLSWLNFPRMTARQKWVCQASLNTFSWIFEMNEGDNNNFATWLTKGTGIYWIAGKAGCGKSTLMKFISNQHQTNDALRTWAGTDELVIATCFFWAAGTKLQKSQEGLLRTLLHTILGHRRDLIARLFPERYDAIMNESVNPTANIACRLLTKYVAYLPMSTSPRYGLRVISLAVLRSWTTTVKWKLISKEGMEGNFFKIATLEMFYNADARCDLTGTR